MIGELELAGSLGSMSAPLRGVVVGERRSARVGEPAMPDPALDAVARGRPDGPIGIRTYWAMCLVLFLGSALQWTCG